MSETTSAAEKEVAETVLSDEDQAAADFAFLLPLFTKYFDNLTGGGKTRVTRALVEFPLNRGALKFLNSNERDAFGMGKRLLDCNTIMVASVLKEKYQKEETAAVEVAKDETNG